MSECKHNWEQNFFDRIYFTCKICAERWNAERLVNYLQGQAEEIATLRQQVDKLKTCDNCKRNEPFKLCMDCTGRDNWQMKGVE